MKAAAPLTEEPCFLKGADSDFIIEEYMERINTLFPSYRLETIEKAGHWLHVDQPDKVKSLLGRISRLLRLAKAVRCRF